MSGIVTGLYITATAGSPMTAVNEVKAIPDIGLKGDRYANKVGTYSQRSPHRDLTVIDEKYLENLEKEFGVRLEPGEHRRNIEAKGIDLQELIGKEFTIGPVRLLAIRASQPCKYLEDLTGKKNLLKGLLNSGILVRILSEGTIKIGDKIEVKE